MTDSYHKIKVLAIAPYSGLREILRQTGAGRHDIALTVLDGDNEEGLRVVQEEFKKSSYDLIISRGGNRYADPQKRFHSCSGSGDHRER